MPHRAARGKKTTTLTLAALLAASACHARATPPGGDVGAMLEAATIDGGLFDPSTLRGKPALVTFWRTGCPYCNEALPKDLEAAHKTGATAVAVLVSGSTTEGATELQKLGWDGPSLVDSVKLVERLSVPHVPYTLVLRADGTAAQVIDGDEASADELAAALDAAH